MQSKAKRLQPDENGVYQIKVRFASQHTAMLFEHYQKTGQIDMMNKQFRRGKAMADGFTKILPGIKYNFIMVR